MEKTPILSDYGSSYGTANTAYVPSTAGGTAMITGSAADSGAPSAPPASMFDSVPGYEGTVSGGGGGYLPPPVPTLPMPVPEHGPVEASWNIPSITEDTARDAFVSYASSKCCYSTDPARDGVITNMEAFNTYRYRLETFTETRSTEWKQEPYIDQVVDAFIQPAPGPWEIAAQAPNLFQDYTQNIRVPYTSSVKNCHVCLGMGRTPCKECSGCGSKVCWLCNGSGFRHGNDRCTHCNGRGRDNCFRCKGQGSCECDTCHGKRQLLVFINLKVQWTNNNDDYLVEQSSGLKSDNLCKVTGREMFKDSQYQLYPVMGFPNHAIVQASERLIREHQSRYFQTSRILQQRHTIELIPITRVSYTWKEKSYMYFVYGTESSVNADNYPATCCCSVM
ncbi:protein SSUH2 homolog isoform X1 [Electrophorus electricus]|uniref:Protein SSUH2 homolog n=2 Tax=Electrophorus electricus TaxID=8005 RepID=A0A4W4E2J4_ELEEL|nr:protein SSUH2 homolog isoform X1 [Electrophorus electricus]